MTLVEEFMLNAAKMVTKWFFSGATLLRKLLDPSLHCF